MNFHHTNRGSPDELSHERCLNIEICKNINIGFFMLISIWKSSKTVSLSIKSHFHAFGYFYEVAHV